MNTQTLLIIVILVIIFGGGGFYAGGPGFGLGGVILILVLLWAFGLLRF